jgi:hypothetical protein
MDDVTVEVAPYARQNGFTVGPSAPEERNVYSQAVVLFGSSVGATSLNEIENVFILKSYIEFS